MYQLPPLLGYTLQESYTSRIVNYTNSAVREPSLPTSVLDWPSCKRHGRGGDTGRHAHSRRSQMTSQTNTHNTPPSPKTTHPRDRPHERPRPERPPSPEARPRETALTNTITNDCTQVKYFMFVKFVFITQASFINLHFSFN